MNKSLIGFAALSPEQRKEMASKGGKAAHEQGAAHHFTPEEAKIAGRKGGLKISENREHMAAIGRLGGLKSPKLQNNSNNDNDQQRQQ